MVKSVVYLNKGQKEVIDKCILVGHKPNIKVKHIVGNLLKENKIQAFAMTIFFYHPNKTPSAKPLWVEAENACEAKYFAQKFAKTIFAPSELPYCDILIADTRLTKNGADEFISL